MKFAAAYLRVSTDEQAEHGISLPAQKTRLQAYIQAQGWELYDFYMDDGYSGKNLDRPAMIKMICDAQAKKFDCIVVIKLDRLSRRQKDVLYLLEDVLETHGIGFKSVTEPFDTTTPFGKAAIGMMAVFAQLERETIVERVKMAKKEAARQGRFGGGDAPYGYIYDTTQKKLVIDEDTAPTVQLIYALYESGHYGFRSLAMELTNRKISAPKGGIWYKDTVKVILSNAHYTGYIHRCGEITEGTHQAIIERERWHKVQDLLKGRYVSRPTKDPNNLLAGLIYCGKCGARMRFKTQNWKDKDGKQKWQRQYYLCYSRSSSHERMVRNSSCDMPYLPVSTANQAVIDHLMRLSLSPSLLKESVAAALGKRKNDYSEKDLISVKKEITATRKKIDRWNNAFENGAIEVDDLMQRTRDLRERRQLLEARLLEIEAQINAEKNALLSAQDIVSQIKKFHEIWEYAGSKDRRVIIGGLVDSVIVHSPENIEVNLLL